jgi:hypothetical protein
MERRFGADRTPPDMIALQSVSSVPGLDPNMVEGLKVRRRRGIL